MKALTAVTADHLHDVWPWVRRGLDEIKERWTPDWIPEDVYTALKAGSAHLFVIGGEDGFCVLQRQMGYSGARLFVWAIHGKCAAFWEDIDADLAELAHGSGCDRIVMQSRRDVWEPLGFVPRETIYERRL